MVAGPFDQRVEYFCSVPRGGVKKTTKQQKKNNQSRTDRAVCQETLSGATRWRESKRNIGRGLLVRRVLKGIELGHAVAVCLTCRGNLCEGSV